MRYDTECLECAQKLTDGQLNLLRETYYEKNDALCNKNRTRTRQRCVAYALALTTRYTLGEVTSQSLWSRYDRHFVGITRYSALS